ncbi:MULTISPECIES: succinate--CoA ligase subunit beta [unclassified Tolypothrix]|uniref:succinate--CoA ligase subunit beta n=1 Tax=unclassified Tolypothrix TaxID=2649714 RepID=UPI0005EAB78E|nr:MULTISPECIES: succinate--CoA ligase subunit beta [unclassified Tolypothrix]BAY90299.1 ATP-grasp domain-containing protein [Microchaete diplosiphon NIES-3275]EKE98858.1 succinate-CoA ligase, beta subunit [Tolypothrix sp. PCC 7601]MBE9086601.1 succinate--CoA ligase subunit beta [Tolypothrix sp. LEGE 11397]UYD24486.1 succinate--CoA ligase subunit beta [Tolypothrix sp. PCC 7712]UYD33283.1 succinate--CoA ligase subunit beta [Tolypothrix sp. PCC 7601]
MDLLEYQVKEWFGKIGIPVLPSQRIDHPTDLKRLKIRYPVVLKSQVHAAERAKAGGVRIVETTIDAIAAAQTIFNLPIWGELPEVLLAESKYDAKQELYLAVVLDTALCRPVLLGCKEADIDWETAGEKMEYVVVEQEFSPFYARRLALKLGLEGTLMQSISAVIEKMYQLFIQKDLDLVEINPLAISVTGQVMALNGKVRVNERSIGRHPDIAEMAAKINSTHRPGEVNSNLGNWDGIEMHGKIGILGNGTGSVLATLDLVANAGGKPGVCLNLRHGFQTDTAKTTFCDRLDRSLQILAADRSIQVILLNLLGSIPQYDELAEVISKFLQLDKSELRSSSVRSNGSKSRRESHVPRLVVRLAGSEFSAARKALASLKTQGDTLILVENLDEAVAESVRLAKSTAYKK